MDKVVLSGALLAGMALVSCKGKPPVPDNTVPVNQ